MRSKFRRFRVSPAVVISVVAVFFAIGGIGYAASKIGTGDIKNGAVTGKKIHKKAVSTGKIKKNAVNSAKVKDNSLTGADIDESTLGAVPDANNLGGVSAGDYQRTLRFAVVSANATGATVVRGNATGAGRISPGNYFVSFPADIRNCAYVATNGDVGAGAGPPGEISVEQRNAADATDVEVRHYNSAGSQTDYGAGDGFHITVVC